MESGEVYWFLAPNPRSSGVELRKLVGHLPGDFIVDGRQTSGQLFDHLARLRDGVEKTYLDGLVTRLGLDPTITIRSLSKGNRQEVGLAFGRRDIGAA